MSNLLRTDVSREGHGGTNMERWPPNRNQEQSNPYNRHAGKRHRRRALMTCSLALADPCNRVSTSQRKALQYRARRPRDEPSARRNCHTTNAQIMARRSSDTTSYSLHRKLNVSTLATSRLPSIVPIWYARARVVIIKPAIVKSCECVEIGSIRMSASPRLEHATAMNRTGTRICQRVKIESESQCGGSRTR